MCKAFGKFVGTNGMRCDSSSVYLQSLDTAKEDLDMAGMAEAMGRSELK